MPVPVHPQMHIQLVQFNQGKVAVTDLTLLGPAYLGVSNDQGGTMCPPPLVLIG